MSLISSINVGFGCQAFLGCINQRIQNHDREAEFAAEVERLACLLDSCSLEVRRHRVTTSSALIIRPSMHIVPYYSDSIVQLAKTSTALSVCSSVDVVSWRIHMPIQSATFDLPAYQAQCSFIQYELYEEEDDQDYNGHDGYDDTSDGEQLMLSSMVFDHEETSYKHDLPRQEHFIIDLLVFIQTFYQTILSFFFTALFNIALKWDRDIRFNQEVESLASVADSFEATDFVFSVCPLGQPSAFNMVSVYQPWRQAKLKDETH